MDIKRYNRIAPPFHAKSQNFLFICKLRKRPGRFRPSLAFLAPHLLYLKGFRAICGPDAPSDAKTDKLV